MHGASVAWERAVLDGDGKADNVAAGTFSGLGRLFPYAPRKPVDHLPGRSRVIPCMLRCFSIVISAFAHGVLARRQRTLACCFPSWVRTVDHRH